MEKAIEHEHEDESQGHERLTNPEYLLLNFRYNARNRIRPPDLPDDHHDEAHQGEVDLEISVISKAVHSASPQGHTANSASPCQR